MRKLLSVFLAGCLLLLLPATIWASAETTYESEQGQAMIKAPSSASPNASANTEADVDSSDDSEGTLSPSGSSSGMDWSAANTASTPSSASRQFEIDINIIFANIESVQGAPIGGTVAIISGARERITAAIAYLIEKNVGVEVLKDARVA